jgi:hypothetical protein
VPKDESRADLIVAIDDDHWPLVADKGPAATPDRVLTALLMHYKMGVLSATDVGDQLPPALLTEVRQRVEKATAGIRDGFRGYANEDQATGDLFNRLRADLHVGAWHVVISTQGFSTHLKEPRLGADWGLLVDIRGADGRRVVKALWLQAKLAESMPADARTLPSLSGQVQDMRRRTKDAYAIIYTPNGVFVRGGEKLDQSIVPSDLLVEALRCTRGDRDGSVIAETMDRDLVLEVLLSRAPTRRSAP